MDAFHTLEMTTDKFPGCRTLARAYPCKRETFMRKNPRNVVMFNPCDGGTEDNWEFDLHTAWYGRPLIYFTCELSRVNNLCPIKLRLAFVSWFHEYDISEVSDRDAKKCLPLGKRKWEALSGRACGRDLHLYEASPLPNYGVVPVRRAVGQAFLVPNFDTPTIPYHMKKHKPSVFPDGTHDGKRSEGSGSRLWVLNKVLMHSGTAFSVP
uniref:Uncharacterized protein n=1 Tax=Hemiselmis andersenii TaxID=464988 RepID=A0A7S1HI76_HEMAN